MMGQDEADEVTQDVFVRAWEKLGSFRGEAAFGTWLYRVAINVALARRQQLGIQRGRMNTEEGVLESIPVLPPQRDMGMDFERAIGRLPEGARQVFVLHDIEGYRHEEIGRLLGVTSGTSKAQLHRARMMLRRNLSR
jgi:RNA polymerase sigma-70 factor (ECF subfamily)